MIASLRGRLLRHQGNRGVVDVRDVGYEVFATRRSLEGWAERDELLEVVVSTQVREDAITLYGFTSEEEREAFNVLIGVSGVGPKLALACLDAYNVAELRAAVEREDITALAKISGVGKRTAQRLALELKGKLPAVFALPGTSASPTLTPAEAEPEPDPLALALVRLGYAKVEIDRVLRELPGLGIAADAPIAERLRGALAILYNRR